MVRRKGSSGVFEVHNIGKHKLVRLQWPTVAKRVFWFVDKQPQPYVAWCQDANIRATRCGWDDWVSCFEVEDVMRKWK